MNDLRLTLLTPSDASALSGVLRNDDEVYGAFFVPFSSDGESVEAMLASVKEDRFWGILVYG